MNADKYHKDSEECGLVNLDLVSPPKTCTSIRDVVYTEVTTLNSFSDGNTPLEFCIPGTPKHYVDLSRTKLYLKLQIVKRDGSLLSSDDLVAMVNIPAHSMFQQLDIFLNDKLVTSASNLYPYRCMFETLLNYGKDAKETWLTSEMFYDDESEAIEQSDPTHTAEGNSGLFARYGWSQNSNIFDLICTPHADLFHQDRPIIPNVDIRLKFTRSPAPFALMAVDNSKDYMIKIHEAVLLVRLVEPSDSIILEHSKALERGVTCKYPVHRCEMSSYSIPQGVMNHTRSSAVKGQLPVKSNIGYST